MPDRELMGAAACLPPQLRTALRTLSAVEQARCEEIRLRAGQLPAVTIGGQEHRTGEPHGHRADLPEHPAVR